MTQRTLLLGLVLMLIAGGADRAWGISITETEPNDTLGTAFDLDGLFSTGANPDIVDAETIPWVSIAGTGNDTFDYYSFTVNAPGSRGIFDIDYGVDSGGNVNTSLGLWAGDGELLKVNRDDTASPDIGQGSSSFNDPFIDFEFSAPGVFVVGVARDFGRDIATVGGFADSGLVLDPQDTYTLQVSLESATLVPMPGAAWGGLGLIAGFGLLRRRRPTVAA
jgi:hypothetical protein